ncbi:MAG TPA: hypothetical protein PJ988_13855 [Anaerolinea sp.]|nr:hypothetical protein [Anaerolinea sp.]
MDLTGTWAGTSRLYFEGKELDVRMFNIPPDEGEQIAVLAQYTRTPPGR